MRNTYHFILIGITVIFYLFERYLDHLNTKNWSDALPEELRGIYNAEKYAKSQRYEREVHRFSNISGFASFAVNLALLNFFGYGWLDTRIRGYLENPILIGLAFFGCVYFVSFLVGKPFSWYRTFVIEERYGFNKMTPGIFIGDSIKELTLTAIIGGGLGSLLIWTYTKLGSGFWISAWILVSSFSIFMTMFYSNLIVPLFNKQTPLEEGELKRAIEDFARKSGFNLENVLVIDGSKRSTKANAYFSGLGPKKRVVLYDLLVKDYSPEEIVAILAHEIGHFKKKHTLQMLVFSILEIGLILFLFSLMIGNPEIAKALGSDHPSFHLGFLAFGILLTPLSISIGMLGNMISRKNEYQADAFAGGYGLARPLCNALKKLSVDTLSNLRPHPIYEFVHFSHPTLLKRLKSLKHFG